MIGTITNRRAHLTLFVRGEGGQGNVEFTIDTGFTGTLTLPPTACDALRLTWTSRRPATLADSSQTMLDFYRLSVLRNGAEENVEVLAIESEPLLGMTFLEGYEVTLQVVENGTIRLEAL